MGATRLVPTEEHHFKGSSQYLQAIRSKVRIPILRKDFIIDEYQLYESLADRRGRGVADCGNTGRIYHHAVFAYRRYAWPVMPCGGAQTKKNCKRRWTQAADYRYQ